MRKRHRHGASQAGTTPAERSLRARLAVYTLHAKRDAWETTAPARAAFLERFEREVDPEGALPDEDCPGRAEAARKAHFTRLERRSAQVGRKRVSAG